LFAQTLLDRFFLTLSTLNRDQNNDALYDVLPEAVDVQKIKSVVQYTDDKTTEDCAADLARHTPLMLVPPSTTAAMASISAPSPAVGWPENIR
jgi:hypothetical protein